MTDRNVVHATFCIERAYPVPPARAFAAWASPEAKAQWFAGPEGFECYERSMDFRSGGAERLWGRHPGGKVSDFQARYFEVIPDARIIYGYDMYVDGRKISVSLATIEFHAAGQGTRLVMTEQGAFLDGYDDAGSREEGTRWLLEKLGQALG
ncbi:SRPBCC family protein [Phenylobacterium sp.]|uniref:SRPBCC family protein n=1 Tax=Phenylobacterium sp. TaxID=1871053 RepID=UPI002D08C746|nr:SRPBCC family protein [Phenylobacterium sp.]HVI33151.1 SRPBCC family protein [Phenylobacterium sp.]